MAKSKKRIAPRKKALKRGKASAKPVRKKAAKRAMPKKRSAVGPVIEDTIIDVIDEPFPGVVRVREYEMITTTAPGPKVK